MRYYRGYRIISNVYKINYLVIIDTCETIQNKRMSIMIVKYCDKEVDYTQLVKYYIRKAKEIQKKVIKTREKNRPS